MESSPRENQRTKVWNRLGEEREGWEYCPRKQAPLCVGFHQKTSVEVEGKRLPKVTGKTTNLRTEKQHRSLERAYCVLALVLLCASTVKKTKGFQWDTAVKFQHVGTVARSSERRKA